MRPHIVTVVYQHDAQLSETYNSCDLGGRLDVRHWIFVKRHDDELPAKYPRAMVVTSQTNVNESFDHLQRHDVDNHQGMFMNACDHFYYSEPIDHQAMHTAKHQTLTWLRSAVPVEARHS